MAKVNQYEVDRAKKIQKVTRIVLGVTVIPITLYYFWQLCVIIWVAGAGGWLVALFLGIAAICLANVYDHYVWTPLHRANTDGIIDE